ncbi:DUF6153 family protein [Streptomyces sp. NPDC005899]|uniref:DUF6153 family protein n=1 Tax=Streptomyces sp. NPDC005899 TaxID=3155716 RepID=UPI0033EEB4F4
MTVTRQTSVRPRRGLALLVLAVLVGLLAMHALAPAAMPASHTAMPGQSDAHMTSATAVHVAGDACEHVTGDGAGGRMHHADATCAAAGTSASPAAPVLAPLLSDPAVTAALPGWPLTPIAAGRAPPDLAQLQLLRI